MIIDATDLILGRMAAVVAKHAMLGEKVDVVNCEHAVVSGSYGKIIEHYLHKRFNRTTPAYGPFIPRMPDRFVRRTIRGMVPRRGLRGRDAFDNVMCYIGVPTELQGKKIETLKAANIADRKLTRFTRVSDICKQLGAKI